MVRSLGRAGYRVLVSSARGRSLAGFSRWTAAEFALPDPLTDPAKYEAEVRRLVAAERIGVVIPMTEPSLLALAPLRDSLPGCVLPVADLVRFRAISDKEGLLAAAPTLGIAIPSQRVIASPAVAAATVMSDVAYPVVVKPARSVGESADGARTKLRVRHAAGSTELREVLNAMPEAAYPLLIQQRIVGPGIGIFLLRWGGRTLASFAHRRIREKPPSGGVSVYRESTVPPPGLVALSEALLDRYDWQGVAMVEYKIDGNTGVPYLMEINGRFWGSLQLAVDAGVDFPALLVAAALGREPSVVQEWRPGVRLRWWWGDVDHLLARLRRSDAELALPPGEPSRIGAVLQFLRLWRPGDRNEILRWTDPLPFVWETLEWCRGR